MARKEDWRTRVNHQVERTLLRFRPPLMKGLDNSHRGYNIDYKYMAQHIVTLEVKSLYPSSYGFFIAKFNRAWSFHGQAIDFS